MKKILAMFLILASLNASAFWNNNNWGWNNMQDNGIFGFNPYNYWNPNWYAQEMDNMIDEFDNNRWNNNYYGYTPNGYNPYNSYQHRGPYWRNNPWSGYNMPIDNQKTTQK